MVELVPWMIDAILLIVVIEFFVFRSILIRANAKKYVAPLLLFLLSGAFLLIALRLTMTGAHPLLAPLALLLAGVAHLATLGAAARLVTSLHSKSDTS